MKDDYLVRLLSVELSKIDLFMADMDDVLGPILEIANAVDGSSTKLEAIIK